MYVHLLANFNNIYQVKSNPENKKLIHEVPKNA